MIANRVLLVTTLLFSFILADEVDDMISKISIKRDSTIPLDILRSSKSPMVEIIKGDKSKIEDNINKEDSAHKEDHFNKKDSIKIIKKGKVSSKISESNKIPKSSKPLEKSKVLIKDKSVADKSRTIHYTLGAIMNSSANINGKWYNIGEKIDNYKIADIMEDSVYLLNGNSSQLIFFNRKDSKIKIKLK